MLTCLYGNLTNLKNILFVNLINGFSISTPVMMEEISRVFSSFTVAIQCLRLLWVSPAAGDSHPVGDAPGPLTRNWTHPRREGSPQPDHRSLGGAVVCCLWKGEILLLIFPPSPTRTILMLNPFIKIYRQEPVLKIAHAIQDKSTPLLSLIMLLDNIIMIVITLMAVFLPVLRGQALAQVLCMDDFISWIDFILL